MLKQLLIRNIAIIDCLTLCFRSGLTAITGESGSGKSVLLDAIALAFGAKVSPREVLRSGCERGQVELLFDIGGLQDSRPFRTFLEQAGVPLPSDETEVLLSRELTPGGSRSRINGAPVTRELLEQIRPWIIDLHGQHELTSLFQRERQRHYLDALGGAAMAALKRETAAAYDAWSDLKRKLETFVRDREEAERQRDFIAFQLNELTEARLESPDEDVRMRAERDVLNHAEKLGKIAARGSALILEGDEALPGVSDQLGRLQKLLMEGVACDPSLEALLERLHGAREELRGLAGELDRYADRVDDNPQRMAELSDRLDVLEKLKRKYGGSLPAVIARRDELACELEALETGERNLTELEASVREREKSLAACAERLSDMRRKLSEELKQVLTPQLRTLAMSGATFEVSLIPTGYGREGAEEVEFVFSANPGEALKPLAKVASGGELSRFLLAVKTLSAGADGLLTLVFDEIDSGVSGPTAKAVADKLVALSDRVQVLAITHQPMIAAIGQRHLHVEKRLIRTSDGLEGVSVSAEWLEDDENRRVEVLARLVGGGGDNHDEAAREFVSQLILSR